MNDLQIDYFMAVATNLSFTKTSEELYVSQPAISRQISLLEKELGVRLFDRNNKKTELTEAGQLYYDFFRDMKMDLRNTQYKAAQIQKKNTETVTIGFLEGWDLSPFFPDLITRTADMYPDIEIVIDCCGIKELSTLLLTGNIDIAMTMKNAFSEIDEVDCRDIYELGKIILFSSKSKFASEERLRPADFKDETFIAPWGIADKLISRVIGSYCEPYGFMPEIKFVHNNETMVTFVRNNMGVAFSDEWTWVKGSPDLKWIGLDAKDTISIATMKNNENKNVSAVSNILTEAVHENLGTGE